MYQLQIFFSWSFPVSLMSLNRSCHEPWSVPYATNSGFCIKPQSLLRDWAVTLQPGDQDMGHFPYIPTMFQLWHSWTCLRESRPPGLERLWPWLSLGSLDNRFLFPFHPSLVSVLKITLYLMPWEEVNSGVSHVTILDWNPQKSFIKSLCLLMILLIDFRNLNNKLSLMNT